MGLFQLEGERGLEFLKKGEIMNGVRYYKRLANKLEFFMGQNGTRHFLQDRAPCHRSKIELAWFLQRPHIQLVKWPRKSPNIEAVWA